MSGIVYFDCPSGASGDMILGALVDAGVSLDAIREQLATLPLQGWTIAAREVKRGAFRATKVDVHVDDQTMQIWDGEELIKTVLRTGFGEVRKKHAARARAS